MPSIQLMNNPMQRLLLAVLLLLHFSCQSGKFSTHKDSLELVEFSNQRQLYHLATNKEAIPADSLFFGRIHTTVALSTFYTFQFENQEVKAYRYYLDRENPLIHQSPDEWVILSGKMEGEEKLKVTNIKQWTTVQQAYQLGINKSGRWLKHHSDQLNLNQIKSKSFWLDIPEELHVKDLNQIPFIKDERLLFVDANRQLLGINYGKRILLESEKRREYLNYLFIYDIQLDKIVKLQILNTSYQL